MVGGIDRKSLWIRKRNNMLTIGTTLTSLLARKNGNYRGAGAERLSGSETWKLNNTGKRTEKSVEISETRCRQVFRDTSVFSYAFTGLTSATIDRWTVWIMDYGVVLNLLYPYFIILSHVQRYFYKFHIAE